MGDHLWKPGQSGNPNGRPKVAPELKKYRRLCSEEIMHTIAKYARMKVCDAELAVMNKELPVIDHMILKNLLDYTKLGYILERTIGKVPDRVEVSGTVGDLLQDIPTENLLRAVNG